MITGGENWSGLLDCRMEYERILWVEMWSEIKGRMAKGFPEKMYDSR